MIRKCRRLFASVLCYYNFTRCLYHKCYDLNFFCETEEQRPKMMLKFKPKLTCKIVALISVIAVLLSLIIYDSHHKCLLNNVPALRVYQEPGKILKKKSTKVCNIPKSGKIHNIEKIQEQIENLSAVTSGIEFDGSSFRKFPKNLRKFYKQKDVIVKKSPKSIWKCKKWAVATTIFKPAEAMRRFLYRKDWCLVVIGDQDKPKVTTMATQLKASVCQLLLWKSISS